MLVSRLLLISLALPCGLFAQTASRQLPEVVVTASKDSPSLTSPSMEQRKKQIASTTAGGAAVVDSEDYLRGRAVTLKDALDFTAGVLVQPRFGADESRLSIRGSGIQRTFQGRGIWLMQDGMPLNLADGGFEMQAIDPQAARHIEVFRGASSLQYGGTTLGGAINFISHTGHSASPFQTRLEVGSFNTVRSQISSGFVSGPVDGYASITAGRTDSFRDGGEQQYLRVFANVGVKISSNLENRFYLTYVDSRSQVPGSLTKAQMLANPEQANPTTIATRPRRDIQLLRLANKLVYSDGDHSLTLSTFWSWKDQDQAIATINDQLSNDLGFDLRYDGRHQLLGLAHDLTLGTGFMYGSVEDDRFVNVGGQRGALNAQNRLQSINATFYLQDQIHLTQTLSLILGASATYANRDFNEETRFGGNNTDRQQFWGYSPRLGLLWEVTPQAQIYFNASRSFEPPTFGELIAVTGTSVGLVALRPQTATTLELGTRGRQGRLAWDFSYYYSWIDDELLTLGVPLAPTLTSNAGRTIHQGIEFSLDADLLRHLITAGDNADRLVLRQNFLFNDFRFGRDARWGDREIPGVPRYYYRAELLYEHPSGFYAGPNVEWSPRGFATDMAHTSFADPYSLLGLRIGFRAKKGLSVFFEARNLTDEIYSPTTAITQVATPATAGFLPGDGRSFYGGVEWKW